MATSDSGLDLQMAVNEIRLDLEKSGLMLHLRDFISGLGVDGTAELIIKYYKPSANPEALLALLASIDLAQDFYTSDEAQSSNVRNLINVLESLQSQTTNDLTELKIKVERILGYISNGDGRFAQDVFNLTGINLDNSSLLALAIYLSEDTLGDTRPIPEA